MQNSRSQAKQELSASLALEVLAWQKAGNAIKQLPACAYAQQLYCTQDGRTQESTQVTMRVGTFVPSIAIVKPISVRKTWELDESQRDAVNARQREVYREWIDNGLTQKEAEKIANREKMRLFYALRRTRETD
jgi:hypothetical protein